LSFYTNLVRKTGGEITEKKPLDYIPEPDRTEIIHLKKGIEELQFGIKSRLDVCEIEPLRNITTDDYAKLLRIMQELTALSANVLIQVVLAEAHFFKDKESSQSDS